MSPKTQRYIEKLQLKPHPEGGYYKEIYRAGEMILPEHLPKRYKSSRNFSTSIYFLLEGNQVSNFHRLKSDEQWHFYDGSSIVIYVIKEGGNFKKYYWEETLKKGNHLKQLSNIICGLQQNYLIKLPLHLLGVQ